ncbi:MAG: AEC family transporter [Oscillospiraceae bacterium]|nr:AEC family transporter [Oscillospiraceae bacterium]
MFILLGVGYMLYRLKFLDDDSTRRLSNIVITVINPIVIFNAYQTDFKPELAKGLLYAMILAFSCQTVMVLIGKLAVRKKSENFRVERFAAGYSNCAFMGIPLVQAAFGAEGVFYLTAFITAFNVFMWTHGVILMSGQKQSPKSLLKILISPAIISIVLGLLFFLTGLRVPEIIGQPLNYLGAMNTPLAMIVSGATIAKAGLLSGVKNPRIYAVQSLKLLITPALLAAAVVPVELLGVSSLVVNTILIAAASPTASSTIMFSYKFGENERYASHHFAISTIASMATIPLIMALVKLLESIIAG